MTAALSIKICLDKAVEFRGRASLAEFWFFVLFLVVVIPLGTVLLGVTIQLTSALYTVQSGRAGGTLLTPLATHFVLVIYSLAVITVLACATVAVMSRRLHDINVSGWWILLAAAVPTVGALIFGFAGDHDRNGYSPTLIAIDLLAVLALLGVLSLPGTKQDNRFGPPQSAEPPLARPANSTSALRSGLTGLFRRRGRASRPEFWWTQLLLFVFLLGISLLPDPTDDLWRWLYVSQLPLPVGTVLVLLFRLLSVYGLWLLGTVAVSARRLHDIGTSGWWLMPGVVIPAALMGNLVPDPFGNEYFSAKLAWLLWCVFCGICCIRGTKGENRYGPDPLAAREMSPKAA